MVDGCDGNCPIVHTEMLDDAVTSGHGVQRGVNVWRVRQIQWPERREGRVFDVAAPSTVKDDHRQVHREKPFAQLIHEGAPIRTSARTLLPPTSRLCAGLRMT